MLSRLEGDTWQVGLPERGRVQIFSASPADVVKVAQGVYAEWMGKEKGE